LSLSINREAIFSSLEEKGLSIDILINNVGIGYWRYFQDTPWEKLEHIINTNVKCITHMTKLAIASMLERNSGHIVNLSSTAAFIGSPNAVCYSATKAYIHIFSETLAMELKNSGVKVLCVFPGATTTHFWEVALMTDSKYDKKVRKMTAEEVAKEIILAIKRGKSRLITGRKNKFSMLIAKFLPRELLNKVALKRFES
ncbi:MAG: SDR family NAD(P)-dependent oxidoreductase, partial [Thermodesulfobacteriota bacterium]|nr:SDR family NAD(P)-dependent oxidoreductase [Thermodesulfobacteriota bacterium]